jgi:hypothetical protein
MSRLRGTLIAALIGLSACAPSGGALAPSSLGLGADGHVPVGWLHVEPYAIAFKRGTSPAQAVRVWQNGYEGRYAVDNACTSITVTLQKYTRRNAAVWSVRPNRSSRVSCVIRFFGSRGPRGTDEVKVRVLR